MGDVVKRVLTRGSIILLGFAASETKIYTNLFWFGLTIYLFILYVCVHWGSMYQCVCVGGGEGINVPECSRKGRRELLTVNSFLPPWGTQRSN